MLHKRLENNLKSPSVAVTNQKGTAQGKSMPAIPVLQKKDELSARELPIPESLAPAQKKQNNTGLPDNLKSGVENLSGIDISDVKVHYNSSQPAQLNALAYAQGTDIHIGPGQEKHLPHEAWHAVQQKQGRVQPTRQMKQGVPVNDDKGLETEADVMGAKAFNFSGQEQISDTRESRTVSNVAQLLTGFEAESTIPIYDTTNNGESYVNPDHSNGWDPSIGHFLFSGLKYGLNYGYDREKHFHMSADHNELKGPHNKLFSLLLMHGLLKDGAPFRDMSNLEYISTARDELDPQFNDLFNEDTQLVKAHLERTLSTAQSDKPEEVQDTGGAVLTGIPYKAIIDWVKQNNVDPGLFEQALQELKKMITNKLYIQQTTGVLPEDIPALYKSAIKSMKGSSPKGNIMAIVMELSNSIGENAFEIGKIDDEDFKEHKGAVNGFMVYLATHLLVDSLSITNIINEGSTDKNLFPYFPKVPLSTAFNALPKKVHKPEVWEKLVDSLLGEADKYNGEFFVKEVGLKLKTDLTHTGIFENPLELNMDDKTDKFSYTESKNKPKTKEKLGKMVTGEEVHIGIEKNLDNLDEPDKRVFGKTQQKAIPVEDRFFGAKFKEDIDVNNFTDALWQTTKESQDRHLSHLTKSKDDEENIIEKTDKKLATEKRISEKTDVLQKKIDLLNEEIKSCENNIISSGKNIESCKTKLDLHIITDNEIGGKLIQLEDIQQKMTSLGKSVLPLNKQFKENIITQEVFDKNTDVINYRLLLKEKNEILLLYEVDTIQALNKKSIVNKQRIDFYKGLIKTNEQQIIEAKQQGILYNDIKEQLQTLLKKTEELPEDNEEKEKHLDARNLKAQALLNSTVNKLGVDDQPLSFEGIIEKIKKDNRFQETTHVISYAEKFDLKRIPDEDGNKELIKKLLKDSKQTGKVVLRLETEMKNQYGSTGINKTLIVYLEEATKLKNYASEMVEASKKYPETKIEKVIENVN
ncbi:DUF4157 domain-containing protein [Mucilaginibacter sp. AW1-3]